MATRPWPRSRRTGRACVAMAPPRPEPAVPIRRMTEVSPRYADWKAPAEDGQTLVWPEPPGLLADARDNAARLRAAHHSLLQGVPLPDVRARARAFIGHEADAPLVATGHQT